MAYDFSVEPEYQEKLQWARRFVDEEVVPLEVADLTEDQLHRAIEPLQQQVKEHELWAGHLDRELGGLADARRDERDPRGHRLEHRLRPALLPRGDELDVESVVRARQLVT